MKVIQSIIRAVFSCFRNPETAPASTEPYEMWEEEYRDLFFRLWEVMYRESGGRLRFSIEFEGRPSLGFGCPAYLELLRLIGDPKKSSHWAVPMRAYVTAGKNAENVAIDHVWKTAYKIAETAVKTYAPDLYEQIMNQVEGDSPI